LLCGPQHDFAASPQPSLVVQQFVAVVWVGPQQAFASLQQADPSVQHFWTAAQQPLFSAQHFNPFSQQPSRASAAQQAVFSLQQASLAEQQSLGVSAATTAPVSISPKARNEPTNSFVYMESSPVDVIVKDQRSLRRR